MKSKSLPADVMNYKPERTPKREVPERFRIGGSDRLGESSQVQTVYSPADPARDLGSCYQLTQAQIPALLKAAHQGFLTHSQTAPAQRAAILENLARLLAQHQEALAKLIALEAGKPITLARHEVNRSIALCTAYAEEVLRNGASVVYADGRQGRMQYFPLGPVLAITPFNFPLNLVLHKLAPAIAAGSSITIKPAPQTPLTALMLGRLATEAGYEAISVIPTTPEIAQSLVENDVFKKLSFTGSAAVGWHLKALAGKKSVTLELGGNAALIIEDFSEPVWEIAQRAAFGSFAYAGQICISVQRILVQEALLEEFSTHFKEAVRTLKVGDPLDEATLVGPMIDVDQVQRARNLIKDAISHGGNVVYGGNTYNMFTMNPTVIDRVNPAMKLLQEECFAPLVSLESYTEFDEALAKVNSSRFGLQAGLYTLDARKIEQAYRTLEVGGLILDDVPTFRADRLPYGGVKDSGQGREGVLAGIADMSYIKTLVQKIH